MKPHLRLGEHELQGTSEDNGAVWLAQDGKQEQGKRKTNLVSRIRTAAKKGVVSESRAEGTRSNKLNCTRVIHCG